MLRYLLCLLVVIFFTNCSKNKNYQVTGTILELRKESKQLLIKHDEIPGFMMPMTMPFNLLDTLGIQNLSLGDSVKFILTVNQNESYAHDFFILGKGTIITPDLDWQDEHEPLEIGQLLSNASFLDLDSQLVSLSDSDGKLRLISFIFTRCPMPNMCPAVVLKNSYLAEQFKNDQIEFIIISFDYLFDSPSIMKLNYSSYKNKHSNLQFYSSWNNINSIYSIAGQSFVRFWGIEENDIGHSLRSILVDNERRLLLSYDGLDWKPEKAAKDIKNILDTYNF
tara:strand:- start:4495 stop:5334 length:840 start_codon:yes stop_codon:yes gene_type:complete